MKLLAIALTEEADVIVRATERAHHPFEAVHILRPLVEHSIEARRRRPLIPGSSHFVAANSAQGEALVHFASEDDTALRAVGPPQVDIDALRCTRAADERAEPVYATIGLQAAFGGELRVGEGHRD